MAKLFNKEPGTLKEKFEGLEEVPSLKSWRKIEAELAIVNQGIARKRRRKRAALIMSAAAIGLVLFAMNGLQFKDQSKQYQMRQGAKISFDQQSSQANWTLPVKSSFDRNLQGALAQVNTVGNIETHHTEPGISIDHTASLNETHNQPLSKVDITYQPVPVEKINLVPEHIVSPRKKTKLSSKWRLNIQGGQDFSRTALAPRSAQALGAGNGNQRPLQSWSFEPYAHQFPVVLSVGAERRIGRRLSAYMNLDYQRMRANAETPYQIHSRSAVKRGRLDQFGMAVGLNAELIQANRIRTYVGVEAWAAHATNAYTEITQLNGLNKEVSVTEVQLTPSSILSARAVVGMRYRLTENLSLTGSAVITKPVHNYFNELNVYNNGKEYITGLRMGLSLAI